MTDFSLQGTDLSATLTVNDLAKSLSWYQDVLGFAVDRKHEREGKLMAISLRAGAVRVLINQDDGAKGRDRVKGEGFSLMLKTTQDLAEIAQRIQSLGITLDTGLTDTPWGMRMFRLRDPDGFRWTIAADIQ
jgi:uncharacterized glyoxalase superfamily protein PhnB